MSRTRLFLWAGVAGVAALLLGQAWDFYLHAADPTLAHREGIFTLANPGHVLLGIGLVLAVVGVLGAAYTGLPLSAWGRRAFLTGFTVLVAVAGVTAGWAASIELSAQQRLIAAEHQQSVDGTHSLTITGNSHAGLRQLTVTAAQLEAATGLYEQTKAAAAKYRNLKVAIAAGYRPMEPPDLEIVHYINRAYLNGADVLNPQHIQSLIYYNAPSGPVLIGAMYLMPEWGTPGPQIGGALTVWHHHDGLCVDKQTGMVIGASGSAFFNDNNWSRSCPRGTTTWDTPDMLHVWLIDNPNGPFDSDMDPGDVPAIVARSPAG